MADSSMSAISTRGVISLTPLPEPMRGFWVSMAVATHAGVYSADFEGLGIKTELLHPIAAARMTGGDSIRIVLNPGPDHGAVLLFGVVNGDSIEGHWFQTDYFRSGNGRFRLGRVTTRFDWARLDKFLSQEREGSRTTTESPAHPQAVPERTEGAPAVRTLP